jgi:hypothetical protein
MTLFGEGRTVAQWARKVGPARQAVKTSRRISSVSLTRWQLLYREQLFEEALITGGNHRVPKFATVY